MSYFVTNVTNGVIKFFNARIDTMFDITLNSSGNIAYIFITDNEIQILGGIVTLLDLIDSVDPNNPVDSDNDINKTINNAVTAMKKTGILVNLILFLSYSLVGVGYYKKH